MSEEFTPPSSIIVPIWLIPVISSAVIATWAAAWYFFGFVQSEEFEELKTEVADVGENLSVLRKELGIMNVPELDRQIGILGPEVRTLRTEIERLKQVAVKREERRMDDIRGFEQRLAQVHPVRHDRVSVLAFASCLQTKLTAMEELVVKVGGRVTSTADAVAMIENALTPDARFNQRTIKSPRGGNGASFLLGEGIVFRFDIDDCSRLLRK